MLTLGMTFSVSSKMIYDYHERAGLIIIPCMDKCFPANVLKEIVTA